MPSGLNGAAGMIAQWNVAQELREGHAAAQPPIMEELTRVLEDHTQWLETATHMFAQVCI